MNSFVKAATDTVERFSCNTTSVVVRLKQQMPRKRRQWRGGKEVACPVFLSGDWGYLLIYRYPHHPLCILKDVPSSPPGCLGSRRWYGRFDEIHCYIYIFCTSFCGYQCSIGARVSQNSAFRRSVARYLSWLLELHSISARFYLQRAWAIWALSRSLLRQHILPRPIQGIWQHRALP